MKHGIKPFIRIGGAYTHNLFARVQTDGSYRQRLPRARIAMILFTHTDEFNASDMRPIHADSSTEAEWASVAAGLAFALEHGEESIAIENDNLGVIQSLASPHKHVRHEYARYYRNEIQTMAQHTAWTGVRWIPRRMNRADELFKLY
jgi:ribonuclease HI